jgi:membrane-associated phospholipid phosphatase
MADTRTRARRVALYALVALVACVQALCVLELVRVPLWPPGLVLGVESLVVLGAMAIAWRARYTETRELGRWAAIGAGSWSAWALLYYGAAHLTHPASARVFDDTILARLPLVPAFTPVYLGVHVFSAVPYCALPETRLLRRYLLGNLLIVSLSSIAWVALPVRLDRPPFAADLPGFGAWLLRLVYTVDPTTNCFPSAHCSVAVYAALGLRFASPRLFGWGAVTATAICVSTVLTKQHYVADVAAGAALAALAAYAITRRTR